MAPLPPIRHPHGNDWFPRIVGGVPQAHRHRILALDLGQSHDYCAGAKLQWWTYDRGWDEEQAKRAKETGEPAEKRNQTVEVLIRRWPLESDYVQVCRDALDATGLEAILVEFNGPGAPVVNILRQQAAERGWRGRIQPIFTAGSQAAARVKPDSHGGRYVVPKREYVTAIEALQQTGRLKIGGPEASLLIEEMRTFQYRVSNAGNVSFGNVTGQANHDDLVLALGIGCWWVVQSFGTKTPAIVV